MKIKVYFFLLFSVGFILSCNKVEETIAPCKQLDQYLNISKIEYQDNKPISLRYYGGSLSTLGYVDGKLSYLQDESGREDYYYENSKILSANLYGDTLLFETDGLGRIVKMKFIGDYLATSEISYDARGNISKVIVFDDQGDITHQSEFFDFDGKKNPFSKDWGWPVDVTKPYNEYIYFRNFFLNPDGNPKRIIMTTQTGKKLELYYSYGYTDDDHVAIEALRFRVDGNDTLLHKYTFGYIDCE